jgi:hypothetical protein
MQKNKNGPLAYWLRINQPGGRRNARDRIVYGIVLAVCSIVALLWFIGLLGQQSPPGAP